MSTQIDASSEWRALNGQDQDQVHNEFTASQSSNSVRSRSRFSIFTFLLVLISLLSVVSASADPLPTPSEKRQTFADLGARRIMERQTTTTEETESTTSGTIATAEPTSTGMVLPQPFDTTLGNNFTTDSCPQFFIDFLSDATFQSCYPFSLLLQTSHGFFEAEKNFFQTTTSLQAGCEADYDVCNSLMQTLAVQLKSPSACQNDFNRENQIVMQAYHGLMAYPVMYQAGCLQDDQGDYCFANAVTVRDNASLADAYSYYLPLGTTMPVGTRPSCSECLKKTMAIYRSYASNSTQPISETYITAAQQVNMACGPDWVSDVVEKSSGNAAPSLHLSPGLLLSVLLGLLFIAS